MNTADADFSTLLIRKMVREGKNHGGGHAQLYGYQYDQLNRIKGMDVFRGFNNATNAWNTTPQASQDYMERTGYDPNGNILTYDRNGAAAVQGISMDKISYKYDYYTSSGVRGNYTFGQTLPADARLTNRLNHVVDIGGGNYTEDIKSQNSNNYSYDEIGNLTKDIKENISLVEWSVYGKITKIRKTDNSEIVYNYDASGNRISKTANGKSTYYVRDASGNVMSVYEVDQAINGGHITQGEAHLYGSSRLGVFNINRDVSAINFAGNGTNTTFIRGNKFFELTNHLGNVLVTISDKKMGHDNGNGQIDYYNADVVTANDYYPGGMLMPGRKYQAGSGLYRFGFNGKENDNDVKGEGNQQDYGMRIYDPRIGRFLSVDPITNKYPELTPYQFASNSPIAMIDIDGLEGGWELSTPASNLRYHYEMQQKLPQKRTPQAATSSPTPVIQSVHSEAPPLALRQAKQRAMNQGLTLTPEQRKAAAQADIVKQMQRNQATISQGGYFGSEEYKIAKANYDTYGKYLPGLSDFDDLASFANAVKDGKVDDAAIFAVAFVIPEVSGKMLKGPMHHVFTNKNFIRGQQWSKKFAPMFEKAGYKLNDAINKIEVIGHKGPHPEEYHQAVFDRLQSATKGLDGNEYKKAFESTLESLKKEVNSTGTELNKLLIKEK